MGTAATRAKNKWQKENMDRVNLTMPKGKKEVIQVYAETHGQSVNSFINSAIDEKMERDTQGGQKHGGDTNDGQAI